MKSIESINDKIRTGDVSVMSADDLSDMVRSGEKVTVNDVDVVTTATRGCMSGTAAILSFRFSDPGLFKRGKTVWFNGVPALPGPAPNESAGFIDSIVYGTQSSIYNPCYGGGHLFKDFIMGKKVHVEVETDKGRILANDITIKDTNTAKIIGVRNSYKNYQAFTNGSKGVFKTIFHPKGLEGPYKECTIAGCGELNPIENDPYLNTMGAGSKILMNDSNGFIIGLGTKSKRDRPSLMVIADMYSMNPEKIGGILTSDGPEVINTIAVPIPILNNDILNNAKILDENIRLPMVDINNRQEIGSSTYKDVWTDLDVNYNENLCKRCDVCLIEEYCPRSSFKDRIWNENDCINCGFCSTLCESFECNMGSLNISINGKNLDIPITYRASDRLGARKSSLLLKKMIEDGEFRLTQFDKLNLF